MGIYEEIGEILEKAGRYVFIGDPPKFSREEYLGPQGLGIVLNSVIGAALQKAFILGHGAGARATLEAMPEAVKNVYEFDAELDKFVAEKSWQKHRGQLEWPTS